ncbi:NAD(P)/FAD-dependent oxidoreductase [Amycolatopsis anabasis]|uniref:NAD(P)/FAD-dependent oxidoreductase n=1 Tax=Amycolatopsis anabasis TaxID=1840409 RepID=UPI00131C94A1|nr:FAD/NAD(P)-binding oxidoreductase [Amycolatopsis anabasis]
MTRIVLAGAGVAALRAAERLRELGFDGEVILVGAEPEWPYHRPALAKQLLTGTRRPGDLALASYGRLDVLWRRGTAVSAVDTGRRVLALPGGEELRYDGLIIATGAEARHLPGAPVHDPRVHVLRTVADAVSLQRTLGQDRGPVAIIGGGFTGCEIASSLRELDREVTIVSRGPVLLRDAVGAYLGRKITELHAAHGVRLALGATVRRWIPARGGMALYLSNDKVLVAGTVVVAVGSAPAVGWLRGSGLSVAGGVRCGATCHALGAADVVAAGDVAQWPNPRFDEIPRRVEHWLNAGEMGRAAAESLLAGAGARPFTPIPRFWSEQHGIRIQAAGMPSLGRDTVELLAGPSGGNRVVTGFVRDGSLIGVVGLNSPDEMLKWTAELARQRAWPPAPNVVAAHQVPGSRR